MITPTEYYRYCPSCGVILYYKQKRTLQFYTKRGSKCLKCSKKGINTGYLNPFYGKKHTIQTLEKIRQSKIGKELTNKHKHNISASQTGSKNAFYGKHHSDETKQHLANKRRGYKATDETKRKLSMNIKKAMHQPDIRKKHIEALFQSDWLKVKTDKGQLELIEKWNRLGFDFEPNYQIHTDNFLCYVDGYDPIHNIVIEYDSKYHQRSQQKEKDLIRQQKIIQILKPKKFWRYDSVNKTFTDVLIINN